MTAFHPLIQLFKHKCHLVVLVILSLHMLTLPARAQAPNASEASLKRAQAGSVASVAGKATVHVRSLEGLAEGSLIYVTNAARSSVVAELRVRRIKADLIQTRMTSLRRGYTLKSLVGLPAFREAQLLAHLEQLRLGQLSKATGDGSSLDLDPNIARNPTVVVSFLSLSHHATAVNSLLRTRLDPEVQAMGVELTAFAPRLATSSWLNWVGVSARMLEQKSASLVAREPTGEGRIEAKLRGSESLIALHVRPTFPYRWLAALNLSLIVSDTRRDEVRWQNEATGDRKLTSQSQGLGLALGWTMMPLDGVILGLTYDAPLARQWKLEDSSGDSKTTASGSFTRSELGASAGFRWPLPTGPGSPVVEVKAGVSKREDRYSADVLGDAAPKQTNDVLRWIALGAGYVY